MGSFPIGDACIISIFRAIEIWREKRKRSRSSLRLSKWLNPAPPQVDGFRRTVDTWHVPAKHFLFLCIVAEPKPPKPQQSPVPIPHYVIMRAAGIASPRSCDLYHLLDFGGDYVSVSHESLRKYLADDVVLWRDCVIRYLGPHICGLSLPCSLVWIDGRNNAGYTTVDWHWDNIEFTQFIHID